MKHRNSKRYAQVIHARNRAMSRLGLNFNKEARHDLINRIQDGELQFLYKQSNRVKCFRWEYEGKPVDVLYDSIRHTVITFLNPEPEGIYNLITNGLTRKEAQVNYYETLRRNRETKARAQDDRNVPRAAPAAGQDGRPGEALQS